MAGGEGAKPILQIEIDDSSWQSFLKSYADYRAQADKSGDEWAKFNSGVRQAKTAFDDLDESAEHLTDSLSSPKTTKGFVALDKASAETAKSWASISKSIDRANRDFGGLLRNGSKFSSLFSLIGLGGVGAVAGGLFAANKAANSDLASQNAQNRALGLQPGEMKSFTNAFDPAGLDESLINRVNDAKNDKTKWREFGALGIGADKIQSLDPAQLAAEVLLRAGNKRRELGDNYGMFASATGAGNLVDATLAHRASTYSNDDFTKMAARQRELQPQLATDQKTLDAATAERQKIEASLAKTELALEVAFSKLSPMVERAADGVTNMVTAFTNSKEFDKDIREVEDAFSSLAGTLKKLGLVNDETGDKDHGLNPAMNNVHQSGSDVGDWLESKFPAYKAWRQAHSDLLGPDTPGSGSTTDTGITGSGSTTDTGITGSGPKPVNNPGNLRTPGSKTQFQQFDNPDAGALQMDKQLMLYAKRDHLTSLAGVINKWAPASDHNDDAAYIKDVAARTGFDPNKPLNMDDPRVRAAVEAAMIRHESGNKFAQLDRQHIEALLTGKTSPDPMAKTAKTADKLSGFDVVPYDDARAKADDQQSFTETLRARMAAAGKAVSDAFSDGAGARFRSPDQQPTTSSKPGQTQMSPYQVQVSVTSPAGSSTTVTAGAMPS